MNKPPRHEPRLRRGASKTVLALCAAAALAACTNPNKANAQEGVMEAPKGTHALMLDAAVMLPAGTQLTRLDRTGPTKYRERISTLDQPELVVNPLVMSPTDPRFNAFASETDYDGKSIIPAHNSLRLAWLGADVDGTNGWVEVTVNTDPQSDGPVGKVFTPDTSNGDAQLLGGTIVTGNKAVLSGDAEAKGSIPVVLPLTDASEASCFNALNGYNPNMIYWEQ